MPPPQPSEVVYGELYASRWEGPKSYIRSSATVEECITGAAYDMTREDAEFLEKYNAELAAANRLAEDDFEAIMDVFECAASEYSSADGAIVAYEYMKPTLGILSSPAILQHAQAVYDFWYSRRKELGNQPLHPALKLEMHQETDEADPYVCFRRREARQTRKTRARDVQMTEKLKRLRRELEDGRQLVIDTFERESVKRACLGLERDVFEQRARVKEIKARLGIRTDDEDLYNHKVRVPEIRHPLSMLRFALTCHIVFAATKAQSGRSGRATVAASTADACTTGCADCRERSRLAVGYAGRQGEFTPPGDRKGAGRSQGRLPKLCRCNSRAAITARRPGRLQVQSCCSLRVLSDAACLDVRRHGSR